MPHVDYFFDYSSPFAYLGTHRIESVVQGAGGTFSWKPMLLGGLFRQLGTSMVPLLEFPEHKRGYVLKDLRRWAAHFEIPFVWPTRFPMQTVQALRMTLLLDEPAPFIHAVFRKYWAEDQDISDPVVLSEICESLDLDPGLVDRTSDPAVKQMLIDATNEAFERGVFGAPTCIVDGELFWGQDRLNFVAKAIQGWKPITTS